MEIVEFFNTNDPRAQRLSQRGRDPTLCSDASEWKDESFRTSRIEICSKWAHVKENQWDFCPQAEWGGSPEIKLLSIILQRDIVIFNDGGIERGAGTWQDSAGVIINTPLLEKNGASNTSRILPNTERDGCLHCLQTRHNANSTIYLLWNGAHYCPILVPSTHMGPLCEGSWPADQVSGGNGKGDGRKRGGGKRRSRSSGHQSPAPEAAPKTKRARYTR